MSVHKEVKKITTHVLLEMKQNNEKISMLTGYDYSMAKILDAAGVDIILVGDSASNVMAGHETTLPITLNEMIYHASSVIRAIDRALVVVDLPFGSYQGNSIEALASAIRIMKEAGGHAVKLEGGHEVIESVDRILSAGIPVMGHLGLTPQSIYKFGVYTVPNSNTKSLCLRVRGWCGKGVAGVWQACCRGVAGLWQGCGSGVAKVSQGCRSALTRLF
jgi:3-methyl-2-oxobutanoate hydroxymethyltransferase